MMVERDDHVVWQAVDLSQFPHALAFGLRHPFAFRPPWWLADMDLARMVDDVCRYAPLLLDGTVERGDGWLLAANDQFGGRSPVDEINSRDAVRLTALLSYVRYWAFNGW